jgi:hypothetical protein
MAYIPGYYNVPEETSSKEDAGVLWKIAVGIVCMIIVLLLLKRAIRWLTRSSTTTIEPVTPTRDLETQRIPSDIETLPAYEKEGIDLTDIIVPPPTYTNTIDNPPTYVDGGSES